MSNKNKIARHTFQPGAMSIIQMGEQLIGHPSTAINELVKNGYDADAHSCKVYFSYSVNRYNSFAIIFDNGLGMDDKTLFGSWLKPSVSSKRKPGSKSKIYKRSLLGSKGIGRLAAMALGEQVTVITRPKSSTQYNWITVTRSAFKEEKLLSDISFPGDKVSAFTSIFSNSEIVTERGALVNEGLLQFLRNVKLDEFDKGTLIIVEVLDTSVLKILSEEYSQPELSSQFDSYKNTSFYKALSTLITPLSLNNEIQNELYNKDLIARHRVLADEKNEFTIEFGINLMSDKNLAFDDWLPIEPIPIQSVYDYRVYGKVASDGTVIGFMTYSRLDNDYREEEFSLSVDDLKDTKSEQFELFEDDNKYETGEYYFDIRVYDIGENDNLEKLAEKSKLTKGPDFRRVFKSFQGMRISKNGFGVKPYGDEVEDWIGLSKARVQNPGQNVNTNQILGYVFFYSPENDNLEEKTNREGFLENKAFRQMVSTLGAIFSVLGKRRYNYRLLHGLGRSPLSKHSRPDFDEYFHKLNDLKAGPEIVKYSEKFMKEISTSMDNIEESLSFSERLASLGSGIELVYHEMAQPIAGLRTTNSSLKLKKKKMQSDVMEYFEKDIDDLDNAIEVLSALRNSLQPAIGRTRSKKFIPYNTFLKVCNLYRSDIQDHKISIVADKRLENYEIIGLEYAFWITFLNIVNNAIYWLKKSESQGEIRFFIEKDCFIISNSGPPIAEDVFSIIFEYGVTKRTEKNATGLGLAFTRSVLSRNNWSITAENRIDGPAFIIKKDDNG